MCCRRRRHSDRRSWARHPGRSSSTRARSAPSRSRSSACALARTEQARVLGLDGCKGGWVAVALEDGAFVGGWVVGSVADLIGDPAEVVGVDMPIGGLDRGGRSADAAARRLLPRARKSTVFAPPPTAALGEADYAAACDVAERVTGKRISRQAHALSPKILDVDCCWRRDPDRIFEIHPELAFQAMHDGPLVHAKKTREGRAERSGILRAASIRFPEGLAIPGAAPTDVLDAAAVAWSAHRIATGAATSAPDPPERDDAGRAVAIWF